MGNLVRSIVAANGHSSFIAVLYGGTSNGDLHEGLSGEARHRCQQLLSWASRRPNGVEFCNRIGEARKRRKWLGEN